MSQSDAQYWDALAAVDKSACGMGFIAARSLQASRETVEKAFTALKNLAHRGAIDADGRTGDGSGILTPIPHDYYRAEARNAGVVLPDGRVIIAMIFYPRRQPEREECSRITRETFSRHQLEVLWTREVPVDESVLGKKAHTNRPFIVQKFLRRPQSMSEDETERMLFLVRKEIDIIATDRSLKDFYIPNISGRTIIHKGLFVGDEVKNFYRDLKSPDFTAHFAVFHQRFSTNTFPSWSLAHPFRMLAHNGEINTLRGNRNWMHARTVADQPRAWVPEQHALARVIIAERSDSASFDNMLEAYVHGGRSILHAVTHMLPEAWQHNRLIPGAVRDFYEYHACISEPWDGPAAVAFTDGVRHIGAVVDRNGLRPARFKITKDWFFVASEMGCVPFDASSVEENGKLSPGRIIAMDLHTGVIRKNDDIKRELSALYPYGSWLKDNLIVLDDELAKAGKDPLADPFMPVPGELTRWQKIFGYTREDTDLILKPMFKDGKEPVGSMGDDTPLAVFSSRRRLLYDHFKQLFAQVTNPPIDPIREESVTSLTMYLGRSGNVFEQSPAHARQIRVRGPILTMAAFTAVTSRPEAPTAILSATFPVSEGAAILGDALMVLCFAAENAVEDGKTLIVLSDRDVSALRAPIPMLLAVGAVHHHLIRVGKRLNISLLVETGEAREVHHLACLIGFGASAIHPYLALESVARMACADDSGEEAARVGIANYLKACDTGLLKIMSKMGISVLQSYHAAQLFEIVGLKEFVIHQFFTGTPSALTGGVGLEEIAGDVLARHKDAFAGNDDVLDSGGLYRFRRDGEYHGNNPEIVKLLHRAVSANDGASYREFARLVNTRAPMTVRDLMGIKHGAATKLEDVEGIDTLVRRFCTPGISYGAIGKEVHEDLAVAMNRIGAKSDSGEGGEDSARFMKPADSDSKNSAIKQVASGRFGVTAYYLARADELEIKIAQGAKPGEGGQLPGHKVSEDIARLRHSTPGVTLISPPPHHDIYSIEDLAQLIYDLKRANPRARVCVKLVAETGIGTIAAGVVKAHADVILVSGHEGGTGAAPLSSIKHAGLPWELGLSEVQQILVRNGLRGRVLLRTDGGLKTGLDVVKAALLGAEEFGIGTAALIAAGCVMVRQCHLNTCPTGIATHDPLLRAKYKGTPERIIAYFRFIAEEVREILSDMGFKTFDDIVGRCDLLVPLKDFSQRRLNMLNVKKLVSFPYARGAALKRVDARNAWLNDDRFDEPLIDKFAAVFKGEENGGIADVTIRNTHRSAGTRLSFEIVDRYGPGGLPNGRIRLNLSGTAGQSLGAFACTTLEMHLAGEANDYVGKGLSGALITLRPPPAFRQKPEDNILCGNTCLYGATAGKLFVVGRAGERFAVRNSGASAVVEGVGDHGCEYMTGGRVLILGGVGLNFAAGMTGGAACVFDGNGNFRDRCSPADVEIFAMNWAGEEGAAFRALLEEHARLTASPLAIRLLADWDNVRGKFLLVLPREIIARAWRS